MITESWVILFLERPWSSDQLCKLRKPAPLCSSQWKWRQLCLGNSLMKLVKWKFRIFFYNTYRNSFYMLTSQSDFASGLDISLNKRGKTFVKANVLHTHFSVTKLQTKRSGWFKMLCTVYDCIYINPILNIDLYSWFVTEVCTSAYYCI